MLRQVLVTLLRAILTRLSDAAEADGDYRAQIADLERQMEEQASAARANRAALLAQIDEVESNVRRYATIAEQWTVRAGELVKERDSARRALSDALAEIATLHGDDLGRRLAVASAGLAGDAKADGGGD